MGEWSTYTIILQKRRIKHKFLFALQDKNYMDTGILEDIGLTNAEIKVYIALLELGPSSAGSVLDKTGLHNSVVHTTLNRLLEKGLISFMPKGKTSLYVAGPPEKIKMLAESVGSRVDEMVPELTAMYKTYGTRPIVRHMEGVAGMRSVSEDIVTTLKHGEVFYSYSSRKSTDQKLKKRYIPDSYYKIRDQKQLERVVITNSVIEESKKPDLNRVVKVISGKSDLFDFNITQIIYGNKVAFLDYNTETAIVVENKKIAEFQKRIFKTLFRKL